jgi:hypothetical protein
MNVYDVITLLAYEKFMNVQIDKMCENLVHN